MHKLLLQFFVFEVLCGQLLAAEATRVCRWQIQLGDPGASALAKDGSLVLELPPTLEKCSAFRIANSDLRKDVPHRLLLKETSRSVQVRINHDAPGLKPLLENDATVVIEVDVRRVRQMTLPPQYIRIRQRLLEQFYFNGLIAESYESTDEGELKFADQTIYMGQALAVFATEMAILRDQNKDVVDPRQRIREILDSIDQLDRVAEPRYGNASSLNGFIVRDDIRGPDDVRLSKRFGRVLSDWQNPDSENASPSGDQIFGLMFGLWSVKRFSGDDELVKRAKKTSARVYDYARRCGFVLQLPDGTPTRRGSDVRWLSSLMQDLDSSITGNHRDPSSHVVMLGQHIPVASIRTFWNGPFAARALARLSGSGRPVRILGLQSQGLQLNSFAVHQLLTAIAMVDNWTQMELEAAAEKSHHHLSTLFWCTGHAGYMPISISYEDAQAILAACPASGPAASLATSTRWHKDNRWIRCLDLDKPSSGQKQYNGLDWLLFHNICEITFAGP